MQGFNLGVDEYIAKPFSPKILVARVEAVIRRSSGEEMNQDSNIIEAGGIRIDIGAHTASIDGQEMVLSVKEFELLTYFLQNQGIALSRDTILYNVWNYDYFGNDRTIDTHIKMLRNNLREYRDLITTVRGMGYKFDCK